MQNNVDYVYLLHCFDLEKRSVRKIETLLKINFFNLSSKHIFYVLYCCYSCLCKSIFSFVFWILKPNWRYRCSNDDPIENAYLHLHLCHKFYLNIQSSYRMLNVLAPTSVCNIKIVDCFLRIFKEILWS